MYHIRKSSTTKRPKSFRPSLNVSDFYSVNPVERLDGIGIEVGRYRGEIHQSCRKTFIKVLMDSLTKVRDRKSILHIGIECTMSFMVRDEFMRDLDSRCLEIYLFVRTIHHYYRYFIVA